MTAPDIQVSDSRPIVDSHIHWWDPANPWMLMVTPEQGAEIGMGDVRPMLSGPYLPADFDADARRFGVDRAVWVMATMDPSGIEAEVAWVQELAADHPMLAAIVGSVDPTLSASERRAQLEAQAASPLLRGVRSIAGLDLESAAADDYMRMLADHGLVFDHMGQQETMKQAAALASRHPDVPWVLEHCGWPAEPEDADYVKAWREGIRELAHVENVHCKLSGLAMSVHGFDLAAQRPFLEHCLEHFGPQRVMFGSNFPVDRNYGSYDEVVAMNHELVADLAEHERDLYFAGNAERVYGLGPSA